MKRIRGLVLVALLVVGIALGIYAGEGFELVLEAAPAANGDGVVAVNRAGVFTDLGVKWAGAECDENADCDDMDMCTDDTCTDGVCSNVAVDCGAGHICYQGQCYETCGDAADCADDGLDCTKAKCGPVDPPNNATHVCSLDFERCRETHTVSMTITVTVGQTGARAIGVLGTCPDETGIPDEECVFSVEAVQYRRSIDIPMKFNVVCVDTESRLDKPSGTEDTPTCSPVEREPLAFALGPTVGVQVQGKAGAAAGLFAGAAAGANVSVGFSAPVVFQRRLRYPLVRRYIGRAGGNILIESGIGSVVAGETVVFAHGLGSFNGSVDFVVTKPVGMELEGAYESFGVYSCNSSAPCTTKLINALQTACRFCGSGAAGSEVAQGTALESDFEIQELIDALDHESQAIEDIIEEVKGRIEEKIPEAFETLQDFLGSGSSNAATAQRSVLVDKMMNLLEDRITNNLEEIRQISRDLVSCPDN